MIEALWAGYGRKVLRYCGVSVFNVIFGQGLLFCFHSLLDWKPLLANLAAVAISAVPAYLLSRRWVWGRRGPNSVATEIVPFWSMALLGLAISEIVIGLVSHRFDGAVAVQGASLVSFGFVWVLKFLVFEKYVWRHPADALLEPAAAR